MSGLLAAMALATVGCSGPFDDPSPALPEPLGDEECTPRDQSSPVDDACGIFVSAAGNDRNAGVKRAPLRTLAEAVERVWYRGKRIYVCAESFEEKVLLPGGFQLFGGLNCQKDWRWIGDREKTTLSAPEGVIPLSISGDSFARSNVEDFHIIARSIDPASEELKGVSSIAVVASFTRIRFARTTLEAGDAAPGAVGESAAGRAASGGDGEAGTLACTSMTTAGGAAVGNFCDTGGSSTGGRGGDGKITSGASGLDGAPFGRSNYGTGEIDGFACTVGTAGRNGADGEPAFGAFFYDGWLNFEVGFISASGEDAGPGQPGQGGGGGGGAKGGSGAANLCPVASAAGGASGGSGGAGGCGGLGGKGGKGGGSSIGLVLVGGAIPVFEDVMVKTGNGGKGGDGGEGQEGGEGGAGGPGGSQGDATGLNAGCRGGKGGKGGRGGKGGGGLGGHSIGVAYTGDEPDLDGVTIETGELGPGGLGASEDYHGLEGVAADTYRLEQAF